MIKYVNSNKADISIMLVSILTSKNILLPLNKLSLIKILLYSNVCVIPSEKKMT